MEDSKKALSSTPALFFLASSRAALTNVYANDASSVVSKIPMCRNLPLNLICARNLPDDDTADTPRKLVFGVRSALANSKTALRSTPGLFFLALSRAVLTDV